MTTKLLLAALALAAPLTAQQPAMADSMHERMMGDMSQMMESSMMRPVMRMMLYAPQHLLARKDTLGLTADQVTRLTALRDAATRTRDAARAEAETHMKELAQTATAAPSDSAVLKTHFQAAMNAMGKAHWAMFTSAVQGRAVLTDAQRTKMQAWGDAMEASMEQHRKMMHPEHPH
jgi:Spy/CpxP family protein refolding chaperone